MTMPVRTVKPRRSITAATPRATASRCWVQTALGLDSPESRDCAPHGSQACVGQILFHRGEILHSKLQHAAERRSAQAGQAARSRFLAVEAHSE